jgi:hypothetical protein
MRTLTLLLLLFCAITAQAATRYVRADAAGNGSGSDWTNAYKALPGALVRGDTYYVGDGSYPAYVFDDATSGSTPITIKKATAADSGSAPDWQPSYGDGQAVFGGWTFRTSHYTILGQTRNGADWEHEAAYGMDINGEITIDAAGVSNLRLSHFSVGGTVGSVYPNTTSFGIKMTVPSSPARNNLYFGYCYIHNTTLPIHSRSNSDVTLEYCHLGPGFGKEAISHQTGGSWNIRNNKFIDSCVLPASEGCTAVIGMFNFTGGGSPVECYCDNMLIYGNVFAESGKFSAVKADGIILMHATNNSKFFNNSVVRHNGNWAGAVRLMEGVGNEIKNNLWYWVGDYDGSWGGIVAAEANSVSNNWCYYGSNKPARLGANCSAIAGTRFNGSEDPFVGIASGNYNLKGSLSGVSPRNNGLNLGAAYGVDMNGNPRGADGAWDIGALEFAGSTAPVQLAAPVGLRVVN